MLKTGTSQRLRTKEQVLDYRMFPEPDLPEVVLEQSWIDQLQKSLPELPYQIIQRYAQKYGISAKEASVLVEEPGAMQYFENLVKDGRRKPTIVANWITNVLFGRIKTLYEVNQETRRIAREKHFLGALLDREPTIEDSPVSWERFGEILDLLEAGEISGVIGRKVLDAMFEGDKRSAREITKENGWILVSDPEILAAYCDQALQVRRIPNKEWNSEKVIVGCIGQVMKISKGMANPIIARDIIIKKLKEKYSN